MSKTINEIIDILIQAVKEKASDLGGVIAVREEKEGDAVYYVDEDFNLKTAGMADADGLDSLGLQELALIIEHGEAPDPEELEERGLTGDEF